MDIETLYLSSFIRPNRNNKVVLNWDSIASQKSNFWELAFSEKLLEVNLSGVNFITSDGLIWLYHIFATRKKRGLPKNILTLSDEEENVNRALKTFDLTRAEAILNLSITNSLRYQFAEPFPQKMGELNRLVYVQGGEKPSIMATTNEILMHVSHHLEEKLGAYPGGDKRKVISTFVRTLSEIVSNIRQHGAYNGEGYGEGFASVVKPPKSFPIIRYAFFDVGEGFLNSIKLKPDYEIRRLLPNPPSTEAEAIFAALIYRLVFQELKVMGLYDTLDFIKQRSGRIVIISRGTRLTLNLANVNGDPFRRDAEPTHVVSLLKKLADVKSNPFVPGTSLMIELHMPNGDGD